MRKSLKAFKSRGWHIPGFAANMIGWPMNSRFSMRF